jgi:hypothetical protein
MCHLDLVSDDHVVGDDLGLASGLRYCDSPHFAIVTLKFLEIFSDYLHHLTINRDLGSSQSAKKEQLDRVKGLQVAFDSGFRGIGC